MRPIKWTEPAIRQAFDYFVGQHGRLPTKQEMYEKYNGEFPRPLSVKRSLGITLGEYLETNYPSLFKRKQARVYGVMPNEYWIDDFKKQYVEYNNLTEVQYNKIRKSQTPNTQTIAKMIGVSTWGEVLDYCGFQKDKPIELTVELIFDETLENYQTLNNTLKNFIINL